MATDVSQLAQARREKRDDARVRKTLANIRKAFYALILRMGYEDLTVAELCKEACIGRKTFYMHFSSLDDLMDWTLARMAEEYVERIQGLKVPCDLREITRQFYLYSEEQGLFYEKLISSKSYQAIGGELLRKFVAGAWRDSPFYCSLSPALQELLLCFLYSAGSAMYKQWVMGGKKISIEDMVEFSTSLLAQGVEGIAQQMNFMIAQNDRAGDSS